MKPRPCPHIIRRTIKWGGAAVTVLLVVVWIGSTLMWVEVERRAGRWSLGADCTEGRLVLTLRWWRPLDTPAWSYGATRAETPTRWSFDYTGFDSIGSSLRQRRVFIPGWVFVLSSGGLTIAAWHSDARAVRRARVFGRNACPKCNYDRTGLVKDAVCPECGSNGGLA
jgi:ssDNA-binding Zn-finger/Zn-ribbon topoisomerase 1